MIDIETPLKRKIDASCALFFYALEDDQEHRLDKYQWATMQRMGAADRRAIAANVQKMLIEQELKQNLIEAIESAIELKLKGPEKRDWPDEEIVQKLSAIKFKIGKHLLALAGDHLPSTQTQDCVASAVDDKMVEAIYNAWKDLKIEIAALYIRPHNKEDAKNTYEYADKRCESAGDPVFRWGFFIDPKIDYRECKKMMKKHESVINDIEKLLEKHFDREIHKNMWEHTGFKVEDHNFKHVKVQELTASQKICLAMILKKNLESFEKVKDGQEEPIIRDCIRIESRDMRPLEAKDYPKPEDIASHISKVKDFIERNLSAEISKIEDYKPRQEEAQGACAAEPAVSEETLGFCRPGSGCRGL